LNLWVDVVGCPTIREEDGLAMSSRNLLLSDRARVKASALNEVMEEMAEGLTAGGDLAELRAKAAARIEAAGFTEIDYLELRANDDLRLLQRPEVPCRLLAAAWLAGVRLIDNIDVPVLA
ncbi:MAG: pantoate--beta-alanine ligase, partial [Pseudomonadota bacterium]